MVWISGGEPVVFSKINETTFSIRAKLPIPNMIYTLTDLKVIPYAPAHYLKSMHIKYNISANAKAVELGYNDWKDRFYQTFNIIWIDERYDHNMPVLDSHFMDRAFDAEKRTYKANPYFYAVDIKGNQLPYISRVKEYFHIILIQSTEELFRGKLI